MKSAGINVNMFKPRSCQNVSSSTAKNAGVPIEQVLKQGRWFNCITFPKYYYGVTGINMYYAEGVLPQQIFNKLLLKICLVVNMIYSV